MKNMDHHFKILILRNHLGEIISQTNHGCKLENPYPIEQNIQKTLDGKKIWQGQRQISKNLFAHSSIYRMPTGNHYLDLEMISPTENFHLDPLTHLMQTQTLLHQIKLNIKNQQIWALILLDLDDFKNINDLYGHRFGNQVLIEAAKRIEAHCKDLGVCARLGGDEFCLLIYKNPKLNLKAFCQTLQTKLHRPFVKNQASIQLKSSMGIAIYPQDGKTEMTLLEHADLAMYEIKKNGKNRFCFYHKQLKTKAVKQLKFQASFKQALAKNEFELFIQKIVDLKSGQSEHAEFIIRWRHPKYGLIQPHDFINKINKLELVVQLDDWVLQHALECITNQEHAKKIFYFINIAAIEFQHNHPNLERWTKQLSQHPCTKQIILEITEDSLIKESSQAFQQFRRLQNTGIHFSIDDFGQGYSNFMNLKKIQAKYLKINQELVQNSHKQVESSIIRAIIEMAHSLKLKVIAEGIETAEQLNILRQLNCDYGQGFYFAKPIPFTEFSEQFNTLPSASKPI